MFLFQSTVANIHQPTVHDTAKIQVMLDAQGYLKLIDFGIAKKLPDGETKTFTMNLGFQNVSWCKKCSPFSPRGFLKVDFGKV